MRKKANFIIKNIRCLGLAFFAGLIFPFAFAPFHLYGLTIISLVLFLISLLGSIPYTNIQEITATVKEKNWLSFLKGWFFGIALFGVGVSWVYVSISVYGNVPHLFAAVLTFLFIALLALFPAFLALIYHYFFEALHATKILLVFPVLWVLFEWLRSFIFTGFPWLLIGHSQTEGLLRGIIPVIGVFGTSYFVALLSSAITYCLYLRNKKSCYFLLGLLILLASFTLLNDKHWTKAFAKPLHVSLVQGNIAQNLKWERAWAQSSIDLYYSLTDEVKQSQLIIWPETAIPIPLKQANYLISQLNSYAKENNFTLITGIPAEANFASYYNAVLVLGKNQGTYYKRKLVPFGEYVPLTGLLSNVLGFLQIPMSDMISGAKNQAPIQINDINVALFVCYEIAYPELLWHYLPKANILVTVSNDAWFGHSLAAYQHLQIGQFEALLGGRWLAFSTNDGITAFIDDEGRVVQRAPEFVSTVLTGEMWPRYGRTPWAIWGDTPIILFLWILFIWGGVRGRKRG